MTTSRKIYMGVLALAIGVLIWDKAFHAAPASGPDPAQAIPAPAPSAPVRAAAVPAADSTDTAADIQSLQSLQDLPLISPGSSDNFVSSDRDLFQMSPSFQRKLTESRRQNPKFRDDPPAPLPALKAILIADPHPYVLLDEKVLGPGQTIGPYRLIQIRQNSVILSGPDQKQYRLSLSDSTPPASAAPPNVKTNPALR